MIGIDIGISTTVVVRTSDGKLKSALVAPSKKGNASRLLRMAYCSGEKVAVTGAGASDERKPIQRICDPCFVDEIGAIGMGGSMLSGLGHCIVASIGTGTAIVHVKGKKCEHMGGTGVGGGAIMGLGKKLVRTGDPLEIAKLAGKGNLRMVNITVGDVYGSGVGIVPADATASNFAKTERRAKADDALGILSMVGETSGVLACFAAREKKTGDIVFIGSVPAMQVMPAILKRTTDMFGFRCSIPAEAQLATALGAVHCFEYNIYIRKNP